MCARLWGGLGAPQSHAPQFKYLVYSTGEVEMFLLSWEVPAWVVPDLSHAISYLRFGGALGLLTFSKFWVFPLRCKHQRSSETHLVQTIIWLLLNWIVTLWYQLVETDNKHFWTGCISLCRMASESSSHSDESLSGSTESRVLNRFSNRNSLQSCRWNSPETSSNAAQHVPSSETEHNSVQTGQNQFEASWISIRNISNTTVSDRTIYKFR